MKAEKERILVCKILILSSTLLSLIARANPAEIQRLRGFAEHQAEQKQFDRGRDRGEQEFLEEQEQWERQRQQDLSDYRKSKKAAEIEADDEGPEALEDARVKMAVVEEHEESRKEYSKNVLKFDRRSQKNLVSEVEELDILSNRPRFAQKTRVLYGAQAKYVKPGKPSSSGSSSSGTFSPPPPAFNSNNNAPFPPPPSFDDFNDNGGFTPAPAMDNFGDDFPPPPPPPPPSMDGSGDFDFPPPAGEDFGF